MLDSITKKLIGLVWYLDTDVKGKRNIEVLQNLIDENITTYGELLCKEREYPIMLAHRNVGNKS
jgi:hypothetical protein